MCVQKHRLIIDVLYINLLDHVEDKMWSYKVTIIIAFTLGFVFYCISKKTNLLNHVENEN